MFWLGRYTERAENSVRLAQLSLRSLEGEDLPTPELARWLAEMASRKAAWTPPPKRFERGYGHMFSQHILQADKGCDFDYLERDFGKAAGEPDIF